MAVEAFPQHLGKKRASTNQVKSSGVLDIYNQVRGDKLRIDVLIPRMEKEKMKRGGVTW